MGEIIKLQPGKKIPHCAVCSKPLKPGQNVIMTEINSIEHSNCSTWRESFIKDRGKYEEVISRYPNYFKRFRK